MNLHNLFLQLFKSCHAKTRFIKLSDSYENFVGRYINNNSYTYNLF